LPVDEPVPEEGLTPVAGDTAHVSAPGVPPVTLNEVGVPAVTTAVAGLTVMADGAVQGDSSTPWLTDAIA
jgi:hypothetical protein